MRRAIKWIIFGLLLGSFVALFMLQVNLTDWSVGSNPSEIQSLRAIPVMEFVILLLTFSVSTLALGWLFNGTWTRALLLLMLATVILTFWTLHSPWTNYDNTKIINNAVIMQSGELNLAQGPYLNFPGLFISAVAFSQLTGLAGLSFFIPFVVLSIIPLVLVFYALCIRFLGSGFRAFSAVFVGLEGNLLIYQYQYHPDFVSIFLVLVVVLLFLSPQTKLPTSLILVLTFATIIWDLSASILIFLFLLTVFFARRFFGFPRDLGTTRLLIVYVTLLSVWLLFWTVSFVGPLDLTILNRISNPTSGLVFTNALASSNITGPLWASAVRVAWIGLLIGLPLLLMGYDIFVRRFEKTRFIYLFFLVPIEATAIVILAQGGVNLSIGLLYAPFAGVLVLFLRIGHKKSVLVVILLIAILLLAPSFLANNNRIISYTYPAQYFYSAQFIVTHSQKNVALYSWDFDIRYFDPSSNAIGPPDLSLLSPGSNLSAVMSIEYSYVTAFTTSPNSCFQYQANFFDNYYHLYGKNAGDAIQNATQILLARNDLVYNDGYSSLWCSS